MPEGFRTNVLRATLNGTGAVMTAEVGARMRSVFSFLTAVLVGASLLELVLKLVWRMGMYLRLKGALATAYFTLSSLQGVLFNFASLLTFILLGLAVYAGLRGGLWEGRLKYVVLASVSLLLLLSAAGLLLSPGNVLALLYVSASALAIVAVAGDRIAAREGVFTSLALVLVAAAFLGYRYYVGASVVNNLAGGASEPLLAIEALALGELLFTLAPLALFLAYAGVRHPKEVLAHKLPLLVASVAAAGVIAANAVSPAMTSVYAIWMLGFSLQHPIVVYVLSVWFLFFTLTACLMRRETRYVGYALLLVFVSGYTHKYTYHHLLGLAGLIVLAKGKRVGIS